MEKGDVLVAKLEFRYTLGREAAVVEEVFDDGRLLRFANTAEDAVVETSKYEKACKHKRPSDECRECSLSGLVAYFRRSTKSRR